MTTRGGVHSTLSLASAFALAWHSTLALGGVTSPSHLPLHMIFASALALHSACAEPSHLASGPLTLHSPLQVPMHFAVALAFASQVPMHMPSHAPAHCAFVASGPEYAEQLPVHMPRHVPSHFAATSTFASQLPEHSPWQSTVGPVNEHCISALASHFSCAPASISHAPLHSTMTEPGFTSPSQRALASSVAEASTAHTGGW